MFELSIHPDSLKAEQIHPCKNQRAAGFQENPTVSSASLYPAAFANLNMPLNDQDNSSNIMSFKIAPSYLDDFIISTGQMVSQIIPEYSASGMSKVEDKISEQSRKCNDANRVEPFVVVEDMNGVVCPYISEVVVSVVVSLSHTEAESIVPESEPEVRKTEIRCFMIFSLWLPEYFVFIYRILLTIKQTKMNSFLMQ